MYKKKRRNFKILSFKNFLSKDTYYFFYESKRLLKAFLSKTKETNIINAIEISIKYIFNKDQLYANEYSHFFRYRNLNINSNDVFSKPLISIIIVYLKVYTYKPHIMICIKTGEKFKVAGYYIQTYFIKPKK